MRKCAWLGIPYSQLDCVDLTLLVLDKEYGIKAADPREHPELWDAIDVDDAVPGDVVAIGRDGQPVHIAAVLPGGHVLETKRGASSFSAPLRRLRKITHSAWRPRVSR